MELTIWSGWKSGEDSDIVVSLARSLNCFMNQEAPVGITGLPRL